MKFKSILIITYGRSGSTLLTGILNSIDRCLIRGENNNFIENLYDAYYKIESAQKIRKGNDTTLAWFGIQDIDREYFLESTKSSIKKLLFGRELYSDYDIYGFKEIRYLDMDTEKLIRYLFFLKQVFPNPCFIFNRRKHEEVCSSSWFADLSSEALRKRIISFESACNDFISQNSDRSIVVDYEKLIELKSGEIQKLFDFIKQPYDEQKIERVLKTKHSFDTKSTHLPENSNVEYLLELDPSSVIYYTLNKLSKGKSINRLEGFFLTAPSRKLEKIYLRMGDGTIIDAILGINSPKIGARFSEQALAKNCRYKILIPESIDLGKAMMVAVIDEEEIPFVNLSL